MDNTREALEVAMTVIAEVGKKTGSYTTLSINSKGEAQFS